MSFNDLNEKLKELIGEQKTALGECNVNNAKVIESFKGLNSLLKNFVECVTVHDRLAQATGSGNENFIRYKSKFDGCTGLPTDLVKPVYIEGNNFFISLMHKTVPSAEGDFIEIPRKYIGLYLKLKPIFQIESDEFYGYKILVNYPNSKFTERNFELFNGVFLMNKGENAVISAKDIFWYGSPVINKKTIEAQVIDFLVNGICAVQTYAELVTGTLNTAFKELRDSYKRMIDNYSKFSGKSIEVQTSIEQMINMLDSAFKGWNTPGTKKQ